MSTSDDQQQRRHLIESLVGEAHKRDYLTSAVFKASIDTLAEMLPVWVDGMAAHAAENDAKWRAATALAMQMPPTFGAVSPVPQPEDEK